MKAELQEIASQFALEGAITAIDSLGEGFINDTFIVRMAGDAPDLFCFVNSGYDERPIAPRKVCMDLLSLPDFEVSPDELLPGLYDALTQNGMLYEFPLTVTLETFLAPSNLIAEPGVTTQDLEAARQKAGEDFVPFESWNTPDNLFWLSIPFYLSKYDDRETGTCIRAVLIG